MQDIGITDQAGREESTVLRRRLQDKGYLTGWDNTKRPVKAGYAMDEVKRHCVNDAAWQVVRLSMKGKLTHVKLSILERWWDLNVGKSFSLLGDDVVEIQVGNYLGALRRGGQLNDDNQIRKVI